jgi:signal transduction histidine kinase
VDGLPSYTTETVVRATDGSRRHLVVTATFQKDRLRPILISALDVTAQVDAGLALRQSADELTRVSRIATLGALTASIGHEVNQPLAAIVTNGEAALRWLARDVPNIDEVKLCIQETVSEGRRAADIVRSLRQLSVKRDATRALVDLNAIVAQVHAMARRDLAEQQVTASLELHPDLPPVAGDAVQLQQVAMNLVNNAIHAMNGESRKELLMRTSVDARSGVRVSIRDTGAGISEEHLPRLFAPFFSTKTEGMGIGLSISRSIIETHRGRIWAERNDGGGSYFHFMIPVAEDARPIADG